MENFNFGETLRIVRQAKGFSQEGMAAGLNIGQSTYSNLEKRRSIPDLQLVKKIADIFGEDPSILLSGRSIKDLLPDNGFQKKAKEILSTPIGIAFYCALAIPFINAAYDMGDGFCEGLRTTQKVKEVVRFITGMAALVLAFYWLRKIQKS